MIFTASALRDLVILILLTAAAVSIGRCSARQLDIITNTTGVALQDSGAGTCRAASGRPAFSLAEAR